MSTIILGGLIFGTAGYIVYSKLLKKGAGGCNCSDCNCPVNSRQNETH